MYRARNSQEDLRDTGQMTRDPHLASPYLGVFQLSIAHVRGAANHRFVKSSFCRRRTRVHTGTSCISGMDLQGRG